MILRKANLNDIDSLCELLDHLFSQESEFKPQKELQAKGLSTIIGDDNIGEIFVAQKDDKIIAMVNVLYTVSTALGAKAAMLEDMVVDPVFRGKETGSRLMEYALAQAKEKGCKRVTLLTDADNLKGQEFYKKQGFKSSSMIPFRKIL